MLRPGTLVALAFGLTGLLAGTSAAATPEGDDVAMRSSQLGIRVEVAQRDQGPPPRPLRQWRLPDRRGPSQEPAAARGYSDGYRTGIDDARDRDRYDPVGSRNYRSGETGYYREYGSRDAYRNNYRAGFRQGYEDGYRDGSRGRR